MGKLAENPIVAVGLSGGVDSAVAAALLLEQGFRVFGVHLRLWTMRAGSEQYGEETDPNQEQTQKITRQLGIPLFVFDVSKDFRDVIVDYYLASLSKGETPNPCYLCNQKIKWGKLLGKALSEGASMLATGHYARITRAVDGQFELRQAFDRTKDQSYILSGLDQNQLGHASFPLGDITKAQVREIARRLILDFSVIPESQDLCFLANHTQEEFLEVYASELNKPGEIWNRQGDVLGKHTGLANYTLGQRKGLGSGNKGPIYVLGKDVPNNRLIIGTTYELGSNQVTLVNVNWISGMVPELPARYTIKIRYKAKPVPGVLSQKGSHFQIRFDQPVRDATPGQVAVFYDDDLVIGSGLIKTLKGENG